MVSPLPCVCDRTEISHYWDPAAGCPKAGPARGAGQKGDTCWCFGMPGIPHEWTSNVCPRIPVREDERPMPWEPRDAQPKRQRPGFVADVYHGGGQREENGDRPRFDLLWTEHQLLERQMLWRDAVWFQKGAEKYGERNWEKFDSRAELVRAQASLGRHQAAFQLGLTDEDHAAAIRANVQFIEYIRERIAAADAAGEGTY